ncbi:MAG TPA: DUF6183 family protein [Acidimicrobiales bacterium]|nr:DUF6183 family protein [Acidimicrobiales bacterium]
MAAGLTAAVERGDLDELTRLVDDLCDAHEWDELVRLRDLCRKALERGKQLWPVAAHAEYRLALEAPAPWAARMLVPGTGRFALGPLPEVAASTHTWADLAPHVPPGPVGAVAAHECAVRGEDVSAAEVPPVFDLPLVLQPWEPAYPVARYHADKADFPAPPFPPSTSFRRRERPTGEPIPVPEPVGEAERALVELAGVWTAESNGRADAVAVEGDAAVAVAALGPPRVRLAEIAAADALAHMAWTAASGGAHGRRRGMAAGRFAAWWAVAAVAGALDDWPLPPDELGDVASELRWYLWDAGEPVTGWHLRLAVEDPDHGLAFALAATDAA